MIESLGGTVERNSQCCMVCNPEILGENSRLGIVEFRTMLRRKKRRVAVRTVSELLLQVLESSLKAERANYIAKHPNLAILGVQLVCPDSVIKNICSGVKFISVVRDLDYFCLRQELKQLFFNIIMLVVNCS